MSTILLANTKFIQWVKILAASVLLLAAITTPALSQSPLRLVQVSGGFDESRHYQYGLGPDSSTFKPSIGQDGYEALRQQQERQDLQRNQDQLRDYHSTPPPSYSGGGNYHRHGPDVFVGPNGKVTHCSQYTPKGPTWCQ
jgi:hypothetical protein